MYILYIFVCFFVLAINVRTFAICMDGVDGIEKMEKVLLFLSITVVV